MMDTQTLINMEQTDKHDIESDFMYNNNVASSHVTIRMGFLRKVYGLLSMQLLLTTIIAGTCAYTPSIRDTIHQNPGFLIACFPITLIMLVVLHFKRHQVPMNFFLLAGFTMLQSITIGAVVSLYEVESVIKALIITSLITVSLTIYTLQSKRDFSKLGIGLLICLMTLLVMGILNVFIASKGMDLVLGAVGAILFSLFIVYDTHMMMHKLSAEEYILATINIYLDIVNLFVELLRLFGERSN